MCAFILIEPFHFMWGSQGSCFFQVDGSEDYTFTPSLILLTRNTQHHENWHCLCLMRLSTALWWKWSLPEANRKENKTGSNPLPSTTSCATRIAEELESSVLEKFLTAFTKKKKYILEADAFKTELHTSIARGKLSLVFLTMTSQYQPHMWFSPSALVCSSCSACLWTHVIRHRHLTLFNSSLQHLCATIKVYPLLRIVNHSR